MATDRLAVFGEAALVNMNIRLCFQPLPEMPMVRHGRNIFVSAAFELTLKILMKSVNGLKWETAVFRGG